MSADNAVKTDRNKMICDLYAQGSSCLELSKHFKISYQRVMQIVKRPNYNGYRKKYRDREKEMGAI